MSDKFATFRFPSLDFVKVGDSGLLTTVGKFLNTICQMLSSLYFVLQIWGLDKNLC